MMNSQDSAIFDNSMYYYILLQMDGYILTKLRHNYYTVVYNNIESKCLTIQYSDLSEIIFTSSFL